MLENPNMQKKSVGINPTLGLLIRRLSIAAAKIYAIARSNVVT